MGLDVYLYHSLGDRAKAKQQEEEFEEISSAKFSELDNADKAAGHDNITDETYAKYKAYCDEIAPQFGMVKGEYGHSHGEQVKIEQKSAKHPEHMFEIGYYRSSYNNGGFNSVMRSLGLSNLYAIVAGKKDCEYEFVPDWIAVKTRCAEAIAALKLKIEDPIAAFFAFYVRGESLRPDMLDEPITSQEAALKLFDQDLQRWAKEPKNDFIGGDYSNAQGYFSRDGLTVHAIIAGSEFLSPTGVWVVAKTKAEEHRLTWYLQALEVVDETCEFVLSQPDPQNYYVHWSS